MEMPPPDHLPSVTVIYFLKKLWWAPTLHSTVYHEPQVITKMNKKQLFSSEHIHSGEGNKYAQKYKYKVHLANALLARVEMKLMRA